MTILHSMDQLIGVAARKERYNITAPEDIVLECGFEVIQLPKTEHSDNTTSVFTSALTVLGRSYAQKQTQSSEQGDTQKSTYSTRF